jgi:glycosyltransferase involved in cell wall biosynthesis
MALMDIFMMTSDYEGLPVAMLEAMALGKPVAATAVGGIPEAVRDGVEGRLVPPANPARMADAVLGLLADRTAAQAMGRRGAERVGQSYHVRDRVAAIESVYAEALAGSPCPR